MQMFERVRKTKPDVMKKLIPLSGDMTMENLGLTNEQLKFLADEIDIIFHCAATLKLEAKLKDAIDMNTIGTSTMLNFAKTIKNLNVFLHLSTAFCHVDYDELGERVYDSPDDPNEVVRTVKWFKEDALDLVTPK